MNFISQKNQYEKFANVIKAIGHPVRLFIIETLHEKDYCVCELTKMIKYDISTVSKHLALLKNAHIISSQKKGNKVYYHLEMPCIFSLLNCINNILKNN